MGPGEFKLPLDLARIRYDVNGDGKIDINDYNVVKKYSGKRF